MKSSIIGHRVAVAAGLTLGALCVQPAQAGETERYGVEAAVTLRLPFGERVEARRKTITFAAGPTGRLEIEAPRAPTGGQGPVLQAGLAFNGDAFVLLGAREVMRAVRVGRAPPSGPVLRRPRAGD